MKPQHDVIGVDPPGLLAAGGQVARTASGLGEVLGALVPALDAAAAALGMLATGPALTRLSLAVRASLLGLQEQAAEQAQALGAAGVGYETVDATAGGVAGPVPVLRAADPVVAVLRRAA